MEGKAIGCKYNRRMGVFPNFCLLLFLFAIFVGGERVPGLHVNVDYSVASVALLDGGFDGGGYVVGFDQRERPVELYVEVDDDRIANLACAEAMESSNSRGGHDYFFDLFDLTFGERALEQFADAGLHDVVAGLDDEQADECSSNRVEYPVFLTEKYRTGDAYRRTER